MLKGESEAEALQAPSLPPPFGGRWEAGDDGRWRLVRLPAQWRDAVRHRTALRSMEVGTSTWAVLSDSLRLGLVGRWTTRRDEMRRLEVAVDGEIVTSLELDEARAADRRVWLYDEGAGGRRRSRQVEIYFPATNTLEVKDVLVEPGCEIVCTPSSVRWCSWGDSITQGTLCPSARQSFVQVAAHHLGWTAINRGFGGAGCPDPMTALAIAAAEPWDVLTIAIGVNSAGFGLDTPDEFAQMYDLCLKLITARCPGKPIVCISPIHCRRELTDDGVPLLPRWSAFREAIRRVVVDGHRPQVHYLDGLELLGDAELLADNTHPGPAGHTVMGLRLAGCLAALTG